MVNPPCHRMQVMHPEVCFPKKQTSTVQPQLSEQQGILSNKRKSENAYPKQQTIKLASQVSKSHQLWVPRIVVNVVN